MPGKRELVVYQCGLGHGLTLALDGAEIGGVRLTGPKCCRQQYGFVLARWPMDAQKLRGLAAELEEQAGEIE